MAGQVNDPGHPITAIDGGQPQSPARLKRDGLTVQMGPDSVRRQLLFRVLAQQPALQRAGQSLDDSCPGIDADLIIPQDFQPAPVRLEGPRRLARPRRARNQHGLPGHGEARRVQCGERAAADHDVAHRQKEPRLQIVEAAKGPQVRLVHQDAVVIEDRQDRGGCRPSWRSTSKPVKFVSQSNQRVWGTPAVRR